jgi:hypothetical protein
MILRMRIAPVVEFECSSIAGLASEDGYLMRYLLEGQKELEKLGMTNIPRGSRCIASRVSFLLRLSPTRGWTAGAVLRGRGAVKLRDKKLTSPSIRVVSSCRDADALKDELFPVDSILDEPDEKELDESKSFPVFRNLTDFISFKKAAILSGVIPIVGWPCRRET